MAKVAAEVGSTANSYQILAKLAAGGMAEIFLARGASSASVERYCVLKRILRERANDAQFVQMFLDEARLAAQLQHPNIASVYDVGMLGESYFFTMEYVHGETVRSLLQRAHELDRVLPLACVLTIIAGAAAGLHHAHERNSNDGRPLGIVHRDVSPSNLMVSFEGNTKLVDFGVAKAANRSVETRSGTVKGKISYLSPEQCRGVRVDRRSDLFSLGIVMWEMLTGKRLYRRASDFDNMTAIVQEPAPRPSRQRPDLPRGVEDIVLRLLRKSVDDRFQSAAEVLEAVEDASLAAGTMLSTSALSRLMRDLFGVRAEPWLALAGEPGSREAITLVSKPVRAEPADEHADPVERHLASLIDLSGAMSFDDEPSEESGAGADEESSAGPVASAVEPSVDRSAPVSHSAPDLSALAAVPSVSMTTAPLLPPTAPYRAAAPPPRMAVEAAPDAQATGAIPIPLSIPLPIPIADLPSGPRVTPPVAPALPVLPARSSADGTGAGTHPAVAQMRALPAAPARYGRLLMVIVGAAAIGVAGALYLADRSSPSTEPVQLASAPKVIDAGQGIVQPSKMVEPAPIDAADPESIDAATPAPIDAAVPVESPPPPTPPVPIPPPPPIKDEEALRRCQHLAVTAGRARQCVLAACRLHAADEAQRWLASVSPKDSVELVDHCKSVGTNVRAPLDCVKNPMDCR